MPLSVISVIKPLSVLTGSIQVLQNKGLRCALNKDIETSIDDLHREADLLRLKYRREKHLLSFMYDMSRQKKNVKCNKRLGVVTRSQGRKLLRLPRPKTEKLKKSLTYRGPKKWNILPGEIQNLDSRTEFKSKVQIYVEQKAQAYAATQQIVDD